MKIHLAANKGTNGQTVYSQCAAKSRGNGKVNRNSREVYQNIPASHIVSYIEFKATPASDRCAHCVDMGLQTRNRQRHTKGLPLVTNLFEETNS